MVLIAVIIPSMAEFHYLGGSHWLQDVWEVPCLLVSMLGLGIRVVTVGHAPSGTSGRNAITQVATVLNTTGKYSVVRHPIYLGNFFMWLGVSLFHGIWWVPLIFSLVFCLHYERIMFAEEEFLECKFGSEFEDWARRTPAFIPRFSQWVAPALPFSWRKVLKGENASLTGAITIFGGLSLIEQLAMEEELRIDALWQVLVPVTWIAFVVLRFLKRHTSLLDA